MLTDWKADKHKKVESIGLLADEVRQLMAGNATDFSDQDVLIIAEEYLLKHPKLKKLNAGEKKGVIRLVFCSLRRELEILQDLADDVDVTEIMVNGIDNVFIEKNGIVFRADVQFENQENLEKVIQRLAAKVGREMNELNPIVDARLADGSRINAVNKNIAINGPILTIRKFNRSHMTMENLIEQGDISRPAAEFLKQLVVCGYNIFVSGGTSSGKTTFLNILSDFIPPGERVILIEDSAELSIRMHENLVRMEAKRPNAQGKGEVTIRDLIKTSLRMRPDRIIVGEVRGGEVVDMLAAMSTGHDGSLSTGHANSPKGMLSRLETMFLSVSNFPMEAVRGQIAEAIDIFVHLSRTAQGKRRVFEISEIEGYAGGEIILNSLYKYKAGEGLVSTGNPLLHTDKMQNHSQEGNQ